MKIAYFDAFSGLSGDMTVGALLHLGVSLEALRAELAKLPLSGYQLSQGERVQSGIRATKFNVEVREPLGERSFRAIRRQRLGIADRKRPSPGIGTTQSISLLHRAPLVAEPRQSCG